MFSIYANTHTYDSSKLYFSSVVITIHFFFLCCHYRCRCLSIHNSVFVSTCNMSRSARSKTKTDFVFHLFFVCVCTLRALVYMPLNYDILQKSKKYCKKKNDELLSSTNCVCHHHSIGVHFTYKNYSKINSTERILCYFFLFFSSVFFFFYHIVAVHSYFSLFCLLLKLWTVKFFVRWRRRKIYVYWKEKEENRENKNRTTAKCITTKENE